MKYVDHNLFVEVNGKLENVVIDDNLFQDIVDPYRKFKDEMIKQCRKKYNCELSIINHKFDLEESKKIFDCVQFKLTKEIEEYLNELYKTIQ